ncbi:Structural maintenance of chromosomes protein 5 [Galdieria sulphuraria]|nr:Structural maintenance of chromosomes protein 5 [Galdieria sulphuraria]
MNREGSRLDSRFKRGQVVSLRLKNFVTFDDVMLQASPSLNLIAAPNGTGKSTVASALSIVFCTNLKTLERASSLAEFIKRGEERATIEVSLYDPQSPETKYLRKISRSFDKNKSESFIDDKHVRQSEILDLCKSYNIQLDNLCVFLPQERISNFTSMEPKELFRRSLEAIGGSDLYVSFSDLVSREDILKRQKDEREADKRRLLELEKEREQLESNLRFVEEVQKLKNELEEMEFVRDWLDYEEKRKHLIETSKKKDELKSVKILRENELKEISNELQISKNTLQTSRNDLQSLNEETRQKRDKIGFIRNKLDEIRSNVMLNLERLKQLKPDFEGRKKNIEKKHEIIKSLKQNLSNRDTLNHLEEQLREKREEVSRKKGEYDNEREIFHSQKLQLENFRVRQLQYLEERNPGIQNVIKLIEQNSHRLQGKVWGPVGLEIQAHDEYAAKILQACVPNALRRTFVVEFDEDFKLLTESICKDVNFDCVSIEGVPETKIATPSNLESLSIYGLYDVVTNIFDASREIKLAMCSHTPYSSIYVGNEMAQEKTEEIIQKTNIHHWFNPKECFRVVVSRFTQEKIVQCDPLRPLSKHASIEKQDDKIEELKKRMSRLSKSIENMERDMHSQAHKVELLGNSIRTEETALSTVSRERNEVFKLLSEIKSLKSQVEREESELGQMNFREEHLKMQEAIASNRRDMLSNLEELQELLKECFEFEKQLDQKAIFCVNLSNTLKAQESELNEKRDDFQKGKDEYMSCKDDYTSKRDELKAKYKELQEKAPMERYRSIVQGYPQDVASFNNLYNRKKARLTAISNIDSSTLASYEKVKNELAELDHKLQMNVSALHEEEIHFAEKRVHFLEEIRNHVSSMNARFSQLFSFLECRGELVLKEVEDLKNLSIEINVSFRDDQPLLPLSGARNSGGEKMVSIMLYIFSMQHLTKAPFRLVDEMNQGMDPWFERKIISLMVEDARNSASSQVFLISPKLLTDLQFGTETRVHFIFNGPCVCSRQDSWNQSLAKYLEQES